MCYACYTHKMAIVSWPQVMWRHVTLCILPDTRVASSKNEQVPNVICQRAASQRFVTHCGGECRRPPRVNNTQCTHPQVGQNGSPPGTCPPQKCPFLCEGNREWRKSRFSLKAIVWAVLHSTAHTCDQLTLKCDLRRKDPHPRGPKTKNRPLIYAFESRLICKTRDLTCCSAGCRAVLTNGNTGHVPRAIGFFSFWGAPNWLWWNNFLNKLSYYLRKDQL